MAPDSSKSNKSKTARALSAVLPSSLAIASAARNSSPLTIVLLFVFWKAANHSASMARNSELPRSASSSANWSLVSEKLNESRLSRADSTRTSSSPLKPTSQSVGAKLRR